MFLTVFPLFMPKSNSLTMIIDRSLFFKERLGRFTPVALYKRATMSNSLRSLMTKSNRSDSLFFMSEFLFRSQKMSESLQKPMSKFPTLYIDRVLQDTLQSPIRKIKKLLVKIVPLQHRYKDEQKKDKQTRCSERVVFRESCRTFYLQKLSRLSISVRLFVSTIYF